jgi:hypothetical protein
MDNTNIKLTKIISLTVENTSKNPQECGGDAISKESFRLRNLE